MRTIKYLVKYFICWSRTIWAAGGHLFITRNSSVLESTGPTILDPEPRILNAAATTYLSEKQDFKNILEEICNIPGKVGGAFSKYTSLLIPSNDILINTENSFSSFGDDPSFIVKTPSGRLPAGLTVVSFDWESEIPCRPRLYFDDGYGFAVDKYIELTGIPSGRSSTLVKFPSLVYALRFDPLEKVADFKLSALMFEEIKYFSKDKISKLIENIFLLNPLYNLWIETFAYEAEQAKKYRDWVGSYEHAFRGPTVREDQSIVFSIIMPVCDPVPRWLEAAINSVLNQSYSKWQLCIADDASTNPEIRKILTKYSEQDARVLIRHQTQRGHISIASNSALELATGDLCVLLDHDDIIPTHALARVAAEIAAHPSVQIIYSDEDKILSSEQGDHRYDPYFKPKWNSELLLTQNYISHLGVYRRSLIEKVGGFRVGFEGAQDWDLILRCSELIDPQEIRHIPEILYHWRATPGSVAVGLDEKPYVFEVGKRVIEETIVRRQMSAEVVDHPEIDKGYRIRFKLTEEPPVRVIIPTKDNFDQLSNCLSSIQDKTTYTNFRITVIDNGSDSGRLTNYFTLGSLRISVLPFPGAFNFSAMINRTIQDTTEPVIVLLNDDTLIDSGDWLRELVSQAVRPDVGAVGGRLLKEDRTIQHAGVVLGVGGIAEHAFRGTHILRGGANNRTKLVQEYSAVSGACIAFRRNLWELVGGLNEQELACSFNDIDFCLRVKESGFRIIYTPFATLYHFESQTLGLLETRSLDWQQRFKCEADYMLSRWDIAGTVDSSYHPCLNSNLADFTIRTSSEINYGPRVGQEV